MTPRYKRTGNNWLNKIEDKEIAKEMVKPVDLRNSVLLSAQQLKEILAAWGYLEK